MPGQWLRLVPSKDRTVSISYLQAIDKVASVQTAFTKLDLICMRPKPSYHELGFFDPGHLAPRAWFIGVSQ